MSDKRVSEILMKQQILTTQEVLQIQENAIEFGKTIERERIFELLKELWETTYAKGSSYPGSNAVLDAIALIKGENK